MEHSGAAIQPIARSALLALAWPDIYAIAGRFHPILFPILTFMLYPAQFADPSEPIIRAAALHDMLKGWRASLDGATANLLPEVATVQS